jgi:enolase-phosphatase E1
MIQAIVTDIEGTTSSLSFVKDVLFPYARAHLAQFVAQHADDAQVRAALDEAKREANETSDERIVQTLLRWVDEDRKATPLKTLQGLIWEHGYAHGDFTGHVYDDAARNLRHWHDAGIKLYVYSSGSVHAQQLLFAHSDFGDLTPLFSGYFDTRIGHKREASSYAAIAAQLALRAGNILFLSDIQEELDAARAAGMQTILLVRDTSAPANAGAYRHVRDFDAISLTEL